MDPLSARPYHDDKQGADAALLTINARESGTQSLLVDGVNKIREGITSVAEIRFLGGVLD